VLYPVTSRKEENSLSCIIQGKRDDVTLIKNLHKRSLNVGWVREWYSKSKLLKWSWRMTKSLQRNWRRLSWPQFHG